MSSILKKLHSYKSKIFQTPKSILYFGLFFAIAVTTKEVINLSYNNFLIFYYGSEDFWNGVNPYSNWNHLNLKEIPLDVFIYPPLFSILFTPFTLMPTWLGTFCWNLINYILFYTAIFNLPNKYGFKDKKFIFFISCILLFGTMLTTQFNPLVAAIFVFSYALLEKKQPFLAILLISISGFTKVYGIFQLSMLLFYPKFWKNVLYSLGIGIVFFFLPLIRFNFTELISYYLSWYEAISDHSTMQRFYSIYRFVFSFAPEINNYASKISIVILGIVFILSLIKIKSFQNSFVLRAQFLGILMSYVILFGLSSESHTYVIAMVGYAIWYIFSKKTKLDKILLWINFFLIVIFPIDIFVPVNISRFILGKLHLGVIVFFATWLIMIYKTFSHKLNNSLTNKISD